MTDSKTAFVGSIPEFYEQKMRPIFFEPYALDLARRVVTHTGPMLELACGTGVLTRQLLAIGTTELQLTATDLNPPMLEEAQRRLPSDPRLQWRQADMLALPFEDGAFGTVICQFGFMFPPDKAAIYREARRVLCPGGRLQFNVWASLDENPAYPTTLAALTALFPNDPPAFLELPFSYHDETLIGNQATSQGFGAIQCERLVLPCRSETAGDIATGLVRGTPLAVELLARGADFDLVESTVEMALTHLGGAAPFQNSMSALVFEARAE